MKPTLLKSAAWLLFIIVVLATLVPLELRPSSGLPLKLERFLAFAILAGMFAFAYPKRWVLVVASTCLAAVALELMQLLVPGRDARTVDALVKVIGAVSGASGAGIVTRFADRISTKKY